MSDAQTIDQLAIKVNASITGGSKLEKFTNQLEHLANVSSKVNTTNLYATANSLKSFSSALNGINTKGISTLANSLSRLSEVKATNLGNLDRIKSQIESLSGLNDDVKNINNLVNALKRLSTAKIGDFDLGKLDSIIGSITNFANALSDTGGVNANITKLVSGISRLASSGGSIGTVNKEFPQLGNALVRLVKDLKSVGAIDQYVAKLVEGIAKLANAGSKIEAVTKNMDEFGDSVIRLINKLKGVGKIDANLGNLVQGLGNLATGTRKIPSSFGQATASVTKLKSALLGLTRGLGKVGLALVKVLNPFESFRSKLGATQKKSRSLASTIGLLYAKFWMLKRIIEGFGKGTKSAQDYLEGFNFFSVAMGKISKENKDQYKRWGYDDAETYGDSFSKRLTSLQGKMTGYKVDDKTGDLDFSSQNKSLGLNINTVQQYQAQIAQITNSTGQLGEVSYMAADSMSRLAADMSSLTNTDLVTVQENFMSALNGQTRAVYKYGINLTSASLQQIAYNHGVTESISKMSMASKQQLRLIGMLEQSRISWGDLSRTLSQPANQLRMLQAGFQNLARTIGAIFVPVLQALYPILNGIVMVLQEFFQWIAKLTGAKLPDTSSIKPPEMPDYEEPADNSGKVADNTKKAAKNAKKLSDNLMGFDQINKLDDNKNDNDNNGLGGNKGVKDIDFSKDLKNLFDKYRKIWEKWFKSSENKAAQYAKKIKDAILGAWKNGGDFTKLGEKFGKWFTDKLAKIPWDKIQKGINKLTKAFATFINGVFKGANWKVMGHTIAEFFNTIVGALDTFYSTVDFLAIGKDLAEGFNTIITDFDWQKFGHMLGMKIRDMVQLAFGFITNIDYKAIGKKLSVAINNFFKVMGEVDPRTGLSGWAEIGTTITSFLKGAFDMAIDFVKNTDWSSIVSGIGDFLGSLDYMSVWNKIGELFKSIDWGKVGKSLSDFAKGLLDAIINVLDGTDWSAVGEAIADFLGNIDWLGILGKVGTIIWKALLGAIKAAISALGKNPLGIGTAIVTILGGLFAFGRLKRLITIMKLRLGKVFGFGIKGALKNGVASSTIESAFLGSGGSGGLFSRLKDLGGKFKNLGSNCLNNFKAGFNFNKGTGVKGLFKGLLGGAKGVGATLKTAINGTKLGKFLAGGIGGTLGSFAIGATAAYGLGKIGGALIGNAIDEQTEAREAHNKAVHSKGKSQNARGYVKIKDNQKSQSSIKDTAKRDGEFAIQRQKRLADYSQKQTDEAETTYKRRDLVREGRINNLKDKIKGLKTLADKGMITPEMLSKMQVYESQLSDLVTLRGEDAKYIMEQRSANESLKREYDRQATIQKNLQKLKKSGIITEKQYQKALSDGISKDKSAIQVQNEQIANSKKYLQASQQLANNMSKANVPMEQQKVILQTLRDKLVNGEISMKRYKDIVNKCGGDVRKLNTEIAKIKPKKKVTISVQQTGLSSVLSSIRKIPNTIPVNVTFNGQQGGTVSKNYQSRAAVQTAFSQTGAMGSTAYNEYLKSGQIKFGADGTIYLKGALYKRYKKFLKGYTVKKFKQGGFIEDGLFTMNKGELAGKFDNGKSVVANNEQITQGFAEGITKALAPAIYSAVKQGVSDANGGSQDINVYLDGKQLADNSVKYIKQMQRSNGAKVFA